MCCGCSISKTQRHDFGGLAVASNADKVCSGLSGRWFHTWKTRAINPQNTLRPMLIPEQTKSTWQPIKSWERSSSFCLWRAGERFYWPHVAEEPLQKQPRSVWELSALSPTPSPESTRERRPHRDTCTDFFYSLVWKRMVRGRVGWSVNKSCHQSGHRSPWNGGVILLPVWGRINSTNFPMDKVESSLARILYEDF